MASTRRAFLAQIGLSSLGYGLEAAFPTHFLTPPLGALPRSTPAAEGVDAQGILSFLEAIQQSQHEFHSFMLLRHGKVLAEAWWSPYAPPLRHTLYSLSKSFVSTAVGLAQQEGKLKLDDPVIQFFPESLPSVVSPELRQLRIRDLLTMSIGHASDTSQAMRKEEDWVKTFLAFPVQYPPGSRFLYNSGATYMCSAILQQVTGQKVLDYLTPRLFTPLRIEGMDWETCPRGINVGGWGLRLKTEDLAKFGQLYLQKGRWQGQQLIPSAWVEEASSFKIQQPEPENPSRPHDTNDWLQGYGYQFWRCQHNAYRGDGANGQFTVMLPEQDAVVVITSESHNMQEQLDLVWKHLLPALKKGATPGRQTAADASLKTKAAALALPLVTYSWPAPWPMRRFQLEANDWDLHNLTLRFKGDKGWLEFSAKQGDYRIPFGLGRWMLGETRFPGNELSTRPSSRSSGVSLKKTAASGYWKSETELKLTLRYIESPHHDALSFEFEGNQVRVIMTNSRVRLSANNRDTRPVLRGKISSE